MCVCVSLSFFFSIHVFLIPQAPGLSLHHVSLKWVFKGTTRHHVVLPFLSLCLDFPAHPLLIRPLLACSFSDHSSSYSSSWFTLPSLTLPFFTVEHFPFHSAASILVTGFSRGINLPAVHMLQVSFSASPLSPSSPRLAFLSPFLPLF